MSLVLNVNTSSVKLQNLLWFVSWWSYHLQCISSLNPE
jgi:hypothetical protein